MPLKIILLCFVVTVLTACSSSQIAKWDALYGGSVPKEINNKKAKVTYYQNVKPIFDKRCVACHGCYDAPCQLKQEAYEGILRGINPHRVYDGSRLLGVEPTRLFEDAQSTSEWRMKGFYPVLNERRDSPGNNVKLSVIGQSLLLKKRNPLPANIPLTAEFDLSLNAKQTCPPIEHYAAFAEKNPLMGMPYGLPGIPANEHKMILDWLSQGSVIGQEPIVSLNLEIQVRQWENFFNESSLKQQLVSRYIYEHLFLASIFFSDFPNAYFRLVRSSTPPGKPIQLINTSRPFDDPKVDRVYYRLRYDLSTPLAKTFMPYAFDTARMQEWKQLFLDSDYQVDSLPGYQPEIAANPFVTFAALPVNARYRFMLNEAQFTIMNFIKGPVCRGHVALNVIQDHFWVFFYDPVTQSGEGISEFLSKNSQHLHLPAEVGNTLNPLGTWHKYSDLQKNYLLSKAEYVSTISHEEQSLGMGLIWDGDKTNANATLTIFRHTDSASIHKGLIGSPPKTAWVIGYPLLERIHYLLVAGFDVYGNLSHQLLSRLYMDFLRIEGEMNFVSLLPQKNQQEEMKFWYRDAEDHLQIYIDLYLNQLTKKPLLDFKTQDPKRELFSALEKHIGIVSKSVQDLHSSDLPPALVQSLEALQTLKNPAIQLMPPTTILYIPDYGVFTLVHVTAYSNLSSLFGENKRRLPTEDQLLIGRGVIGAYPNSFMKIEPTQLKDAVDQWLSIQNETDYQALRTKYGIGRTHPDFWKFSDQLLVNFKQNSIFVYSE